MPSGVRIDYRSLRAVNPETARLAVLEYLDSCGHNVAETARTFGLTRAYLYLQETPSQRRPSLRGLGFKVTSWKGLPKARDGKDEI